MDTDLIVAGVSAGAFIILTVQALKISGLTSEEWLKRTPWIVGGVFLVLFGVEQAYAPAAPYIAAVLKAVGGVVSAVLVYFYGLKPVASAIAENLTSGDIGK